MRDSFMLSILLIVLMIFMVWIVMIKSTDVYTCRVMSEHIGISVTIEEYNSLCF